MLTIYVIDLEEEEEEKKNKRKINTIRERIWEIISCNYILKYTMDTAKK